MFFLICKNKATLNKNNTVIEVEGIHKDGFAKLINCINPLKNDLKVGFLSIVVVPAFKQQFINLINVKETKVYYLFDLLLDKYKQNNININSLKEVFNNVNENILLTVKQYINMEQSVLATSESMFTHRNTINYRISKFINITGMNIRETNSAMVVYLLLKILNI
jgi:hypothetical protein